MIDTSEETLPPVVCRDLGVIPSALLILSASLLILISLGRVAFWDDEAHVALLARSLLATHSNCAWDGRNLMPDHDGAGYDANLAVLMPQLDNYLTALSFTLLGQSPWSARLPFALCGIGALVVFYRLLRLEFPGLASLQLYALGTACFCVPLILYLRNCRYYGISVLLTMGILIMYRRFLRSRRALEAVIIGVLGGLLSLTSILNCACLAGGLIVRHLIFHARELSPRDWLKVSLAGLISASVAIPYTWFCLLPAMERGRLYDQIMKIPSSPPLREFWCEMLRRNLVALNDSNAIPWTLGLGLLGFVLWRHPFESQASKARKTALEFVALLIGFIIVLSAISPQNMIASSITDIRYFTPMLLVIAALMGAVFWWINLRFRLVALFLFLAYISSNLLGTTPGGFGLRWILPAYCMELFQPYPTSCSETCAYLRENAKQDDTLWYFPEWMGKPMIWYIGDKIKFRGILDQETLLPKEAIAKLDSDYFIENFFPNWVVSFARNDEVQATVSAFSRVLPGTNTAYRYRMVKVIDVYWNQNQRPEIFWHSFGPWRGFNKNIHSVFIFKRSDQPLERPKPRPALPSEG